MTILPAAGALAQVAEGRVYVRRIEFEGVTGIDDRVLRREMLQLEGAYLNTVSLDESLRRLEGLPYVASASAALRPVENGVVDIVVTIEESPARRYGGGGGYSESLRTSLHAYYIDENFLGAGRRLAFSLEGSELRSSAELSYTDPYARRGGVSRTIALESRRIERLTTDASPLDADLAGVTLEYGYPMALSGDAGRSAGPLGRLVRDARARLPTAEVRDRSPVLDEILESLQTTACCQSIRFGLDLRRAELAPSAGAGPQLLEWVAANGDRDDAGRTTQIAEADLRVGWRRDTRDRPIFAERGIEQTLSFGFALPGSDAEYYVADYDVTAYRPLGARWTARLRGRLGFGAAYGGDTTSLPPYLNWFAGGPLTVRGYRENGLGPRDGNGRPYGGNLLLSAQLELLTPWPERWRDRARVGFFLDAGNVFSTEDVAFTDDAGRRLDYGFDASALRTSVGLAAEVAIPLGILRVSYGIPLDADDDHPNPFLRDDVERFQISIGVDY
ncbi:MAG TPA: BamA/TamA family outer membrane protein [Gammaproteobacteria bacterium]